MPRASGVRQVVRWSRGSRIRTGMCYRLRNFHDRELDAKIGPEVGEARSGAEAIPAAVRKLDVRYDRQLAAPSDGGIDAMKDLHELELRVRELNERLRP